MRLRRLLIFIVFAFSCLCSPGYAQNNPQQKDHDSAEIRLVPQFGHNSYVTSAAFSADGRFIITGGADRTAKIWEVETGMLIRTFSGCTFDTVAFSPDGRFALTGSLDATARLWDIRTGKVIRAFSGHSNQVSSVAFSPDGRFVLTGSWDKTAKLWDTQTGAKIQTFSGHADFISSVAFSPDGRFALTGGLDATASLWDIRTGEAIRTFSGHSSKVRSVAFSPDGRFVLTGSDDSTAKLWYAQTAELIRTFRSNQIWVNSVAFSPDGRFILVGTWSEAGLWDIRTGRLIRTFSGDHAEVVAFSPDGRYILNGMKLWDAKTGSEIRAFAGHSNPICSVAFSSDGHFILTGSTDRTARLWNAQIGMMIRTFSGHFINVDSVAFSSDGRFVLTGSLDGTAKLWNAESGMLIHTFLGHREWIGSVAFSPDGRFALTGSGDNTAKLWDVRTGELILTFSGHSRPVRSVAFSPDGRFVLTGSFDKTAKLWDAQTGMLVHTLFGHSSEVSSVAFSPDGRFLLTGSWDKTARLWDAQTGMLVKTFGNHLKPVNSVTFSPNGRFVLTGSRDWTAMLWDMKTSQSVQIFMGHKDVVESVAFSPDGRFLLTGSSDNTSKLWAVQAETDHELCSLISFDDGNWVVVDPDGRFDASNGGEVEGLHWVVGLDAIALNQLKERYYEPGLLAKILGFKKEPLRDVRAFRDVKLYPKVQVQAPALGSTQLNINLTDLGGGIGKVRVLVNGKEIASDARGPNPNKEAKILKLKVDLAGAALIPGQMNKVQVIAWNAEGYLSSRAAIVEWTPPAEAILTARSPDLYAIVGGVSNYASETLRLRFAAKDAQDMATALEVGAKRLFGTEKVHLTLLASSGGPRAIPPTRTNFVQAFESARRAKPWDVLVVYLAGHGVALSGEADVYAYLTQEARSTELIDPAVRRAVAITSEELTDWIKQIPALKQVMILDTCAAGTAAEKLVEMRNISSSQIRAIERLKDRTGFHILMGCTADAVSYEASHYGQGLLTYALLQGMRGAALREDEYVDVSRLFQYAADQVPELARNIGGIQRPQIAAPKGASFDIGQLTEEDKPKVPLAMIMPLILRPLLFNPQENDDNLNLSIELRRALTAESYVTGRGEASDFKAMFVDSDELPGAVRPTGTYTVQGKQVVVKLMLKRDGLKVAIIDIEGTRDDLAGLAVKIVRAIMKALGTGI